MEPLDKSSTEEVLRQRLNCHVLFWPRYRPRRSERWHNCHEYSSSVALFWLRSNMDAPNALWADAWQESDSFSFSTSHLRLLIHLIYAGHLNPNWHILDQSCQQLYSFSSVYWAYQIPPCREFLCDWLIDRNDMDLGLHRLEHGVVLKLMSTRYFNDGIFDVSA